MQLPGAAPQRPTFVTLCGPTVCRHPCIFQNLPVQLSLCCSSCCGDTGRDAGSGNPHPRKPWGGASTLSRTEQAYVNSGEMVALDRRAGYGSEAGLSDKL